MSVSLACVSVFHRVHEMFLSLRQVAALSVWSSSLLPLGAASAFSETLYLNFTQRERSCEKNCRMGSSSWNILTDDVHSLHTLLSRTQPIATTPLFPKLPPCTQPLGSRVKCFNIRILVLLSSSLLLSTSSFPRRFIDCFSSSDAPFILSSSNRLESHRPRASG